MATTATLTARVESEGIDSATAELSRLALQADRTETATEQLENESEQLSRALLTQSGASVSATNSLRNLDNSMESVSGSASRFLNFLPGIGTVLTIAATGAIALITNLGSLRSELVRLAELSGTSVQDFQVLSSAFKTLNIDMDKTGDILKDVNDKVGDFILTGGGEFAVIFEKVIKPLGKTKEELRELGPGGILLLVSEGLDKIAADGKEATFIFEALASDSSLLTPLLADNGRLLNEITLAIEEKGLLLTDVEVEALKAANKELSDMEVTIGNIITKSQGFLAAAFFQKETGESIEELVENFESLSRELERSDAKSGLLARNKSARLRVEIEEIKAVIEARVLASIEERKIASEKENREAESVQIRKDRGIAELEEIRIAERGKIIVRQEAEEQKLQAALVRDENDKAREELRKEEELTLEREHAQRRLELVLALNDTESEAIGRLRANRLKDLEVDFEKQLIASRDFAAAKLEINKNSEQASAVLDKKAQDAKEQAIKKAFGTIAGLMKSENKTLFRIGQAAALASAFIDTASAVSKALAAAPPPLSFILAAVAGAAGAVQIATIASASPPAERRQGGQFHADQQLLVGEQGPELVQFGSGGRIANAQDTNRIAKDRISAPEIIIINQTSEEIAEPDVSTEHEQRTIILIRNTVASDLENPNSRVSKSLGRNTTISRQF